MPTENPRLDQRGLVVTGFVDRAGDPVGLIAADGSFHRGEVLVADALRALTYTVTRGRPQASAPAVTFPAHWRTTATDALRRELAKRPEWAAAKPLTLLSDAAAAFAALQAEPGLPTKGVVALCDFGGTGTSITLADAADGYRPIGATVRHADFSGELVDRALLTHVIADMSGAGTADVTGTAAIGSLHRLRTECRGAKERLSRGAVTTLCRRYSRLSRRCPADPCGARRRDPPALGCIRRCVAGSLVPQPNPCRRSGSGRLHWGWRQHPGDHHGALRPASGARDHRPASRIDRGPRRRHPCGAQARGGQPDGRRLSRAVGHPARTGLVGGRRCSRDPGRRQGL